MATDNQARDEDKQAGQNGSDPGYTYSYPRPSEIQPPHLNPFDHNQPHRNPYANGGAVRPGANYPYPPVAPGSGDGSNLPPFYVPPGQNYQPNQGPYSGGSLYDSEATPAPQPTVQAQGLALPLHSPIGTNVILGLIVAVFALQIFKDGGLDGLASGFSNQTLYDLGALQAEAVRNGEWWRLITVMFLHANAIHILFNGYALYAIGRQLETYYGSARLLIIYMLCGISGSIISFGLNLHDGGIAVGASGAIFGLFGALAAFFGRNRTRFGEAGARQFRSLLILIVINLAIGASIPNIDNFAHVGGLVSGLVLGYLFCPVYERASLPGGQAIIKDSSRPLSWIAIGAGWFVLEAAVFVYFLNR